MGDIVVRGRYYVVDERGWIPTVAIRAHVKAPTADADKGLGTGRPDEGVGLEISRTFGRGFMAMIDGGYTVIGQPSGVEYNNNWWYDVGIGQNLGSDAVNLSVFFTEYARDRSRAGQRPRHSGGTERQGRERLEDSDLG